MLCYDTQKQSTSQPLAFPAGTKQFRWILRQRAIRTKCKSVHTAQHEPEEPEEEIVIDMLFVAHSRSLMSTLRHNDFYTPLRWFNHRLFKRAAALPCLFVAVLFAQSLPTAVVMALAKNFIRSVLSLISAHGWSRQVDSCTNCPRPGSCKTCLATRWVSGASDLWKLAIT